MNDLRKSEQEPKGQDYATSHFPSSTRPGILNENEVRSGASEGSPSTHPTDPMKTCGILLPRSALSARKSPDRRKRDFRVLYERYQ